MPDKYASEEELLTVKDRDGIEAGAVFVCERISDSSYSVN